MEIAFVMVTPPRYSLELYTDASVKNPPHISTYLLNENELIMSNIASIYHEGGTSCMLRDDERETSKDMMINGDLRRMVRSLFMAKVK